MADSAKSVNGNGVKTSQKKRNYWFRKYVISLVVFVFGIYFAKNLVGGDTLLDWIMSTIVAGIFGLVNFAWWKGREGGVDEAGKELIRIISCSNESMFEPGREAGATEYYITDDPFK